MPAWSMSRRLVMTLTGVIGGLWLVGVTYTALSIRHEIDEVFDSALQETAQRILPLAMDDLGGRGGRSDGGSGRLTSFADDNHEEYIHYQVREASGRVVLHSHDAAEEPFVAPIQRGFFDDGHRRYFTELSRDKSIAVQVAELPKERHEAVRALWSGLLVPLLVVLPLVAIAIRETVKHTTKPVRDFQQEMRKRDGANLAAIDVHGLPQELTPIVEDVNRLLVRLNSTLEAERAFAANSAHELRNPVAAAHAQASLLAVGAVDPEQRSRAAGLVSTLATLSRKIETILQLARAESGLALSRERMSLSNVVSLLMVDYARKPQAKGRIRFENLASEDVVVMADPDALGIAIQNLIGNALKHSPEGTPIIVRFGPGAILSVRNDVSTVAAEELAGLKQRFARGSGGDTNGSGLGLYIADTIARQSNGHLDLYSPARGQSSGFEAVLRL
jgi:two-component system OmpR family sensor kinase